jgi:hypothetical protein
MTTRIIILGLLVISLSGFIPQEISAYSNNRAQVSLDKDEAKKAQKQLALKLLNQVLETSKSFEDKHLVIEIKADAADVLWKYDEPRARTLFEEAVASVDSIRRSKTEHHSSSSAYMDQQTVSHLRREILELVSRRDPNLARKLVKLAKEPEDGSNKRPGCAGCANLNEKARQYANLAFRAIRTEGADPASVGKLLRLALNEGLDPLTGWLLDELRPKAPALADDIFIEALPVARRSSPYLAPKITTLVRYVFSDFGKGVARPRPVPDALQTIKVPASQKVIDQFLIFIRDALNEQAASLRSAGVSKEDKGLNWQLSYDYFLGEQLLPYVEKYMPHEAANMRANLQELIASVPAVELKERLSEFNTERGSQNITETVGAESKPEIRERHYRNQIMKALAEENIDHAVTIIPKLIDEEIRSYYWSMVHRDKAQRAMNKGDIDAAYTFAKEIDQLHNQAALIARMALDLHYKGEKARALQLITEAEQLMQKAEDGAGKAREMIGLVYSSVQIDQNLGRQDLKAAVEAINAADIPTMWISFKPITGKLTGQGIIWVDSGLGTFRFDSGFQELARTHFDQTLQLAQSIRQKEASTLAQLAICRAVLWH